MTRWNKKRFKISRVFSHIKLNKVLFEPLAKYHWDWYLSLIRKVPNKLNPVDKLLLKSKGVNVQKKLLSIGINKLIKGHTIFVEFIKL